MSGRNRKEKDCLNCGHTVEDHFCSHCGQENIIVKEDAVHMVIHAVSDYFHFESKFFGTIKPLLSKPGVLTQKYVEGKRMSFLHPIKLYIFISIVFFLFILGSSHKEKGHAAEAVAETEHVQKTDTLTAAEAAELKENLKNLPAIPFVNKDSLIKRVSETAKKERANKDSVDKPSATGSEKKKRRKNGINLNLLDDKWSSHMDENPEAYEKRQKSLPRAERDGFIKHYLINRTLELQDTPDVGKRMKEDLLHNIPKLMFLLLPMFALILKWVYIRKKKYYFEHLIYSFHLHSAIFLSVLITMLLTWLGGKVFNVGNLFNGLCFFYIVWYIYRSLRTFYGSTRWITVLKLFFLFCCYTFVMTLTIMLGMAVTVILM